MPQSPPNPVDPTTQPQTPLDRAIDHAGSVKEAVKDSADELFMVNTVLKQEIPPPLRVGDVAQALKKTDELENRMQASAGELAEVNRLLKEEISERHVLEQALTAAHTALSKATPK